MQSQPDFSYDQLSDIISKSYQQLYSNLGRCNILIIGKTGVGKSPLINAAFREPLAKTGVGKPVTQDIRQHSKDGFPITVYDTPGLENNGQQLERITQYLSNLIENKLFNVSEQIHIIWYCINHNSNRLEDREKKWINDLSSDYNIPVILVVTETYDIPEDSEFIAELRSSNLQVRQIIPILANPKKFSSFTLPQQGLDTLVDVTMDLLPEAARNAFANATKSIQLKARNASRYLAGYVSGSAGVGASPIPFSDAPLLLKTQIVMITQITVIFGVDKGFISTIISSIAGGVGATLIGRSVVSNLVKMIPGIGTVVGAVISGGTAWKLTLALGLAYIETLKLYLKNQLKGQEMSGQEVSKLVIEQYKQYVKKGDLKVILEESMRDDVWELPDELRGEMLIQNTASETESSENASNNTVKSDIQAPLLHTSEDLQNIEGADLSIEAPKIQALAFLLYQKLMEASNQKFTFLLIGRTGVGKSSTINSLMAQNIASVGEFEPETFEIKYFELSACGVPFRIIDTPGLCDDLTESGNDQKYLDKIKDEIKEVDCIFFVSKLNETRVTGDEKRAIKLIDEALGSQIWKHTVIVFTFADAVKPEKYAITLSKRTELIQKEIANYAEEKVANTVPSVAVDNNSPITPDGKPWLGNLYTIVFKTMDENSTLSFSMATASRLQNQEQLGQSVNFSDIKATDESNILLDEEQHNQVKTKWFDVIGKTLNLVGEAARVVPLVIQASEDLVRVAPKVFSVAKKLVPAINKFITIFVKR